ncbi:methyl-CpG-binding domain protein 1b isoform X3 [Takifugu rubripes]|uniref:methyl-CpG-binding domain protein 1b isoform X3 n=1 Tax=Takifugu rubripes TaxID=31033 RepID=UPI0011454D63|nr:methyl-CpG-binding domain protein 1 isoform X3 [Takifugu rubripes]
MSQEPESPVPSKEPEENLGEITDEDNTEDGSTSEEAAQDPMEPSQPKTERPNSVAVREILGEEMEDSKAAFDEAPVDWFEPVEEDEEFDGIGKKDPEEESVAGESERSESVYGSEKAYKKVFHRVPRRRRSHPDEGWVEWPVLGEGWKRKEVVRRSGCSMGQKDVYYMGPHGDRFRSRVELVSVLNGILDLTTFDYKTGQFWDGKIPPIRSRTRKRKARERSSSESSWMERDEGADTPDSLHTLTPSLGAKNHCNQDSSHRYPPAEDKIKLPLFSQSSRRMPVPSINGEIGSEDKTLVCAKCGVSFTGTWYDKQRKRPCCPMCWAASKHKEHPMIRFRKWIPCGQCVGCHNTVNCGQCANCKHGTQSPESRRRLCRKRKCICPVRKGSGSGSFLQQMSYDSPDPITDGVRLKAEVTDPQVRSDVHLQPLQPFLPPSHRRCLLLQYPSFKSSDTENLSLSLDMDDEDDVSTDDDEDWHKKRKRRSCGECKACLCRKDCGTCDFCIDKPKFGGSNKKRQKCRLRQCQRQAMMGQDDCEQDGAAPPGRPRPHYTYSRKSTFKKNKGAASGLDLTDNEDDNSNSKVISWSTEPAGPPTETDVRSKQASKELVNDLDSGQKNGLPEKDVKVNHLDSELEHLSRWDAEKSHPVRDSPKHPDEDEKEEFPKITETFSLADVPAGSAADAESQLMKLLQSLRTTVLPILWYAIMVQGPQLQLIQCSKRSTMTDTIVIIDPGFYYKITVQKQPLLPTHPLYDQHPGRLTSAGEVVNLLLALEKYVVCHGLPPKQNFYYKDPLILERASTCHFLVKKKEGVCSNCQALRGF